MERGSHGTRSMSSSPAISSTCGSRRRGSWSNRTIWPRRWFAGGSRSVASAPSYRCVDWAATSETSSATTV
eukprot:8116487-Alexandrium_andersonii.AAC.1